MVHSDFRLLFNSSLVCAVISAGGHFYNFWRGETYFLNSSFPNSPFLNSPCSCMSLANKAYIYVINFLNGLLKTLRFVLHGVGKQEVSFVNVTPLKGKCISNQKWTCFVCYLKIINIFSKNNVIILIQIVWGKKNAL